MASLYTVKTWDVESQAWTPQCGVSPGPYTLGSLRRALKVLRALGYPATKDDAYTLVERVHDGREDEDTGDYHVLAYCKDNPTAELLCDKLRERFPMLSFCYEKWHESFSLQCYGRAYNVPAVHHQVTGFLEGLVAGASLALEQVEE